MNDVKKNYFTTGQMRNALIQIEDQMVHSNWMPSIILGINRGGCIPGVYLSYRLKISYQSIDIRFCDAVWRSSASTLRDKTRKPNLFALEKAFTNEDKILIIDKINATGATFQYVIDNFGKQYKKIRFAALIHNKQSKVATDYQGYEIDMSKDPSWNVFPWEDWDK